MSKIKNRFRNSRNSIILKNSALDYKINSFNIDLEELFSSTEDLNESD